MRSLRTRGTRPPTNCHLPRLLPQLVGGQATIETAVMIAAVVTAIAAMSLYVRRAVQGSMYQSATVHGQQFNPGETWQETRSLTFGQTVTTNYDWPGITVVCCDISEPAAGGDGDPGPYLPKSVQGGGVVHVTVDADSNWNLRRDADYQANP